MAVVELGPIVQSVRGSLGGVTFRQVGSRCVASGKSAGPVSAGLNSFEHVGYLKQATTAWYQLEAPVREFWARYHAAENPAHPFTHRRFTSPFSLFVWYQMARLHCMLPVLEEAPSLPLFHQGAPFIRCFVWYNSSTALDGALSFFQFPPFEYPDGSCWFIARATTNRAPRLFKKCFPTAETGPGAAIANTNKLIWDALGYPPGLPSLTSQPAPEGVEYVFRAWAFFGSEFAWQDWTAATVYPDGFLYPPLTPVVQH